VFQETGVPTAKAAAAGDSSSMVVGE
jgi:hypothetical protein